MKKILLCGYREWALEILDFIKSKYESKIKILIFKSQQDFDKGIEDFNPDLIFFVGWSWILGKEIVDRYKSICLHPSPLPKYRGGSPVQIQIINGEKESAVSLFVMDEFIDKGPILWQGKFPLDGDLADIYKRIVDKGKEGMSHVIDSFLNGDSLSGVAQDETEATYYNRRTPEMSEIKISDFEKFTAEELFNKIRALQDPYPNAFIVCKDGTKLYVQKAKIEDKK